MDKQHILVVDDNHINRLFFESSLQKLGYLVTLAEDGFQAINLCQQQPFQLILMDIRMNGLDGIQTANHIKQIKTHQQTIIVAVSAESFNHQIHSSFDGSLMKPIKIDLLKQALNQFLDAEIFNNELALQVSHNAQDIVQKLRSLLKDQLPDEQYQLKQSFESDDWTALDDQLHKLMGSAKVCAATLLFQQTKITKEILGKKNHLTRDDLDVLIKVIEKTTNY